MSNTVSKFANISFDMDGVRYSSEVPITGADSETAVKTEIQNLVTSYGARKFDIVFHYTVSVSGDIVDPMDASPHGVVVAGS